MQTESQNKQAQWAALCHASALVILFGLPFGNVLAPLIIWLVKRNEFPLLDTHGKEALNFQLSVTLYGLISVILVFVLVGFILLFVLFIFFLVNVVRAAIAAGNGESYTYPLTIRFIT